MRSLLAVPISFVSEHIETLEEIDVEYRRVACPLPPYSPPRLPVARCPCVRHPATSQTGRLACCRRELAEENGVRNWGRVPALNTNSTFIDDLADAVIEALPYVGSVAGSGFVGDALVPMGEWPHALLPQGLAGWRCVPSGGQCVL